MKVKFWHKPAHWSPAIKCEQNSRCVSRIQTQRSCYLSRYVTMSMSHAVSSRAIF
ncbi:hypothetical protein BgiMline_028543, partial [Biomphalaria glabrata]